MKLIPSPPRTQGRPAYAAVCEILAEAGWWRGEWDETGKAGWYPKRPRRKAERRVSYDLLTALSTVLAEEATAEMERAVIEVIA